MAENSVQLQLDLPAEMYVALQQRAAQNGLTVAEQIQKAVEDYLRRADEADNEPLDLGDLFEIIGRHGPGGVTDGAEHHDDYIYGKPHGEESPVALAYSPPEPALAIREKRKTYSPRKRKTAKRKGASR